MSEQLIHPIKIEQFEGPFFTLVELINAEKLDITEVALAKVTEQFISAVHMGDGSTIDPYALADFLVVASRLLYLKSKTLLPMLVWDEEEDESVASLEEQLRMYKEYHDASKVVEQLIAKGCRLFSRERLAIDVDVLFNPPHDLSLETLHFLFEKVIHSLEPLVKIPQRVLKKTVSIKERMNRVRETILERLSINFSELLANSEDKSEIILTFLAVLELVKQHTVYVEQGVVHGEILIHRKQ